MLWEQLDGVEKLMGPNLALVAAGKLDEIEEGVKWSLIEAIGEKVRMLQSFAEALKGGGMVAPPPPSPPQVQDTAAEAEERRKVEREQGAAGTRRRTKTADAAESGPAESAAAGGEEVAVPPAETGPGANTAPESRAAENAAGGEEVVVPPAESKMEAASARPAESGEASIPPEESASSAVVVQQPEPVPTPEPEHWLDGPVRELKAITTPEQQRELGGHMLMSMCGRPPAKLLSLVRTLLPQVKSASEPAHKNLDTWVKKVTSPDKGDRFGLLYDFFIRAQLPGFRIHLSCLRLCTIPDSYQSIVQQAWADWELEAPWLPIPDGAPAVLAQLVTIEYSMSLAETLYQECNQQPRMMNVEVLGWLWETAHSLRIPAIVITRIGAS